MTLVDLLKPAFQGTHYKAVTVHELFGRQLSSFSYTKCKEPIIGFINCNCGKFGYGCAIARICQQNIEFIDPYKSKNYHQGINTIATINVNHPNSFIKLYRLTEIVHKAGVKIFNQSYQPANYEVV